MVTTRTRRDFEDIVIRESVHIENCIFFLLLLLLRILNPSERKGTFTRQNGQKMENLQPCEVVHRDELKEGGIDEEHANKVPPKPREKCHI